MTGPHPFPDHHPMLPADAPLAAADAPASERRPALRRVGIDTWRETSSTLTAIAMFTAREGFQALSKVEVRANGRRILGLR